MVYRESPVFGGYRGRDVVSPVGFFFHVCGKESSRCAHGRINAPEIIYVLRIEELPPEALNRPWSHTYLISPWRNGIGNDLAGHGISGQWKECSRQIEAVACEFL